MFKLEKLTPLVKKRKRIGRGGSRGGTSTKGHKGQKARSGGSVNVGFEGGQMPLYRRLPKRGFSNENFKTEIKIVTLEQLERTFDEGTTITRESLIQTGIIKSRKSKDMFLIKILGNGTLTKKLIVCADRFSASAVEALQQVGGEARTNEER